MMESVKAIVVGNDDVSAVFEEQREHVVTFLADGVVKRRVTFTVLQTRVTTKFEQFLHNSQVSLVDTNVQRRLTSLVANVEVCAATMQELDDFRFVTERCVMHCAVAIFVLYLEVDRTSHQDLDDLHDTKIPKCIKFQNTSQENDVYAINSTVSNDYRSHKKRVPFLTSRCPFCAAA